MGLINSRDAKSNHRVQVQGFNSRVVGSEVPFHTVHISVEGDSIYYAERVARTKTYTRKVIRKDGKIYYRYGGYQYDLSEHNLDD